jgi:intein/homing endonuclease
MTSDIKKRMKYVRSFLPQTTIPKIDEQVWELLGVCLGDGCLSTYLTKNSGRRYDVIFTGNSKDDINYYRNFLIPILRAKFNIAITPKIRTDSDTICVVINNKKVFNFFNNIGMPIGRKKGKINLDDIFGYNKRVKAAILRGLLDTDGCIFARKDEGYRYLHIKISSATLNFLMGLKKLLKEFGLPSYVHWQGLRGGDIIVRGNKNIERWMNDIGSSHPVVKRRYNEWLTTGRLLPKSNILIVDTI